MPVPSSALKISRPARRQESLSTMLVGIDWPSRLRRKPVSIGCCTSTRTSNASPRFTLGGTCTLPSIMARASWLEERLVEARRGGHQHVHAADQEAIAGKLGQCPHLLRPREAHPRRDLGAPRLRVQMKCRDERTGIALREEVDRL